MLRLASILAAAMLAACLALTAFAPPGRAQTNYPWCSNFADGFGGTNCGFVSYEQCMATVRGSGGFCNKNDMYRPDSTGTAAPHRPRKTAARKVVLKRRRGKRKQRAYQEGPMKVSKPVLQLLTVAGAIGLMAMTTPARAQNYPWCAHYGTPYDDTSCAFVSFEQCMASVSGIGGFCQRNDTYTPPLPAQQHARRRHTKSS